MQLRVLLNSSGFYMIAIICVVSSLMVTLVVSLKLFIWDISNNLGDKSSIDNFFIENHPYITITFLILNGLSLLVYKIGIAFDIDYRILHIIHGSMNVFALILGLTPIYTIIAGVLSGKISNHFYSIHCWIGLLTLLFFIVHFCSALVSYSMHLTTIQIKTKVETIHKTNGCAIFAMICLCGVLGIGEKSYKYIIEPPNEHNLLILLPNLLALLIVYFGANILYLISSQEQLELVLVGIRTKTIDVKQKFLKRVIEVQTKKDQIFRKNFVVYK